jgi:hypothetical protein
VRGGERKGMEGKGGERRGNEGKGERAIGRERERVRRQKGGGREKTD